jgi:hypothetical protein
VRLLGGAVLALVLAGCGAGEDAATTAAPPAAGAPIPGGGLSVEEAIDSDLDGPLMVRGYVIERDGEMRLCDGILESYPPQCGEPSLRIDANGVDVFPSEERASLLGEVDGGAIRLTPNAQ